MPICWLCGTEAQNKTHLSCSRDIRYSAKKRIAELEKWRAEDVECEAKLRERIAALERHLARGARRAEKIRAAMERHLADEDSMSDFMNVENDTLIPNWHDDMIRIRDGLKAAMEGDE